MQFSSVAIDRTSVTLAILGSKDLKSRAGRWSFATGAWHGWLGVWPIVGGTRDLSENREPQSSLSIPSHQGELGHGCSEIRAQGIGRARVSRPKGLTGKTRCRAVRNEGVPMTQWWYVARWCTVLCSGKKGLFDGLPHGGEYALVV